MNLMSSSICSAWPPPASQAPRARWRWPACRTTPSKLPQFIPAIVEELIELGLKILCVQLGIVNLEAAARAEQAGIRVVMDRCILIEHQRFANR